MNYVLGIDIGTTAIKAALFDENGFIQGSATKEYELIALPTGEIEQNFEVYEKAFKDAISGAIAMSGAAHEDVVCLGISATGETILFIDEEDKPLRKVITWLDNRAVEEAAYLNSCFNRKEFLQRTGWSTVHPGTPAAKILWVKRHEPDIFRKSQKIVLIKDYFIFRLTGKYVSEDSLMCDSMYWDMGNRQYWPEMLEKLDVIAEMLPEVCQPGMELDTVTPEAAAEFGLNTQMRINVGGMDQACGAIGAGNIRSGMLSESTGSALVALSIVDEFVVDQNGIVPTFAAGIPAPIYVAYFFNGRHRNEMVQGRVLPYGKECRSVNRNKFLCPYRQRGRDGRSRQRRTDHAAIFAWQRSAGSERKGKRRVFWHYVCAYEKAFFQSNNGGHRDDAQANAGRDRSARHQGPGNPVAGRWR